ncbi:MAG: S9 family peptidase [Gemmatimonadetes bacterium]|nr:S9 family peptidase [Gemmatimonadota bacterium]
MKPLYATAAVVFLVAAGCAPPANAPAGTPTAAPSPASASAQDDEDPFLWLEEVEGERAMEWVESRNTATLNELSASPVYQPIFDRVREVLDSRDRIAYPAIMGDRLYNFWQDQANPRGVWRRTVWESYLSGNPQWEVVLDIDALAASEGVNWSYAGASCLEPEYRRCLVRLSRGGADAVEVREFDTETRRFIEGGFHLPEAKQSVAWMDRDALLVAADFGPGSMTSSGYARVAKLWRRGTPLTAAETLFEGSEGDVSVSVGTWRTADRSMSLVIHRPSFFRAAIHVLEDGELTRIDLPMDADQSLVRDRLVVYLRSPWEAGGRSYPAGSLIHVGYDEFVQGSRDFQILLEPTERQTVNSVRATRDYLLVSMLDNVQGELRRYQYRDGRWSYEPVPAPAMGNIGVSATSPFSNRYFFTFSGLTQPTTLYLAEEDGSVGEVRRLPAMFDASGLAVEQHEATSRDGTRVPYFVVRPESTRLDGTNPTLLYAYGGFEVSMTPGYSPVTGTAWLERGGVYVLANIRGGGEFGPQWHRSALLGNRQRAYDDFLAVAEDLIARRITSPDHLGIMGGSNGGLLVGAALTQRPDLFNAVVVQVPLLDMRRYHVLLAGASWMAEYGDPDDPAQWEFIRRYSPYHNLRMGVDYPRVLFTTTTRDDRVHPGHARKMAARMETMGHPVYYFENTEGGHGAGVTSEQRARVQALTFAYLWEQLGRDGARAGIR